MAVYEVTSPDGEVYEINAPDNASETEVLSYAQSQFSQQPPAQAKPERQTGSDWMPTPENLAQNRADNEARAGQQRETRKDRSIYSEAGRQLVGLPARYATETVVGVADLLATPVRAGMNALLPDDYQVRPVSQILAESDFLPKPETKTERIVGDVSKAALATALPLKGAQMIKPSGLVGQGMQKTLTAQPATQLVSGGAAGAGGGFAREGGAGEGGQIAGGLAAGIGTALLANPLTSLTRTATAAATKAVTPKVPVDVKINNALKNKGLTLNDLSESVKNSIRADVDEALKTGDNLSGDSLSRLVEYRLTGATPTKGTLTLNPSDVTRQRNIAKRGAASTDPKAQQLSQIENENNQILLNKMDELGASQYTDDFTAGKIIYDDISSTIQNAKNNIDTLYSNAKSIDGRFAELDNVKFMNEVNDRLDFNMIGTYLPKEIRKYVNQISEGTIPLNVRVAEVMKSIIATAQRSTDDGNAKKALSIVRQTIDDTPLKPNQALGQEAINAFNSARKATYQYHKLIDSTPALKSIVNGVEPDKIFEKQVINGTAKSLENLLKISSAETVQALKNNVLGYIKSKATGGAANEVARLSGDTLRKTLQKIGDAKLKLLFTPDELLQIKSISNVAKYEAFQPVGSAVNNSNTASAVLGAMEKFASMPILGKIPLAKQIISEPVENVVVGNAAKNILNPTNSLLAPTVKDKRMLNLLPYTGLLSNQYSNQYGFIGQDKDVDNIQLDPIVVTP